MANVRTLQTQQLQLQSYFLESPSVERWLRKRAPRTQELYQPWLRRFLRFTLVQIGVDDPDSFLSWAKRQEDNLMIGDLIEKFGATLSAGSQGLGMAIPRSFLKRNGYTNLPMLDEWPAPLTDHPGYLREEVLKLLGYLDDPLRKLYVLVCKDSGLRARHALSLEYWQLQRDLDAGLDIVHLEFNPTMRSRRKSVGITFVGPNTVKVLRELIKQGIIQTRTESRIFPWEYHAIRNAIGIAKQKAGLDPKIQSSHGFRKFFTDSLDQVRMDHHKKMQMEGHSLGVRFAYTRQNVEECRKLYKQAYQYLDLSEEGAVDKRMKELEDTVKKQSVELERLRILERQQDMMDQRIGRIEKQPDFIMHGATMKTDTSAKKPETDSTTVSLG